MSKTTPSRRNRSREVMPGRVNHRTERFQILWRNGRRAAPRGVRNRLELWENRKQIAEVGLVGGVAQQRRNAEKFFERAQRGAMGVVDAVGVAGALCER